MAQVLVIAVAAFNALVVYFLSFLAVHGDGSSDGIVTVRWFGFGAIAIATALSLIMCARGKLAAGIITAAGTLPVAYALSILILGSNSGHVIPTSCEPYGERCTDSRASIREISKQ